jgi:hypothetical protein
MMWRTLAAMIALWMAHAGPVLASPPASADQAEPSADSPRPGALSASVGGCWDFVIKMPFLHPNMRGKFSFTVEGSSLRGTATLHGDELPLRDGTVDGDRVRFSVERSGDRLTFEGELKNTQMEGTMTKSGERRSWTAMRCRPK